MRHEVCSITVYSSQKAAGVTERGAKTTLRVTGTNACIVDCRRINEKVAKVVETKEASTAQTSDGPCIRNRTVANTAHERVIWNTVCRTKSNFTACSTLRIRQLELATAACSAGQFVALIHEKGFLTGIFKRSSHVTTAICKILPGDTAHKISATITARRNAALRAKCDTVKILFQDEVNNTSNGVRTVNCGVAAGHDVYTLHKVSRNGVNVETVIAWR